MVYPVGIFIKNQNNMKKQLIIMLMCAIMPLAAWATPQADYNVVPLPQSITLADAEPFVIEDGVTVTYPAGDENLKRNAEFLAEYVAFTNGIRLKVAAGLKKAGIRLMTDVRVDGSEAYTIDVDAKGVVVAGATAQGVFYGVQTLRKSLPVCKSAAVALPAGRVADSPRFAHRGMMLDCSRHFFPTDFVKRYIDLIAMHNMNVFHWHLTDDQGWRIEIKKYPRLTEVGSVRSGTVIGFNSQLEDGIHYGGYYTQDEAKEIVEYARQRYITVVPEIDMPGHMVAALAAYPELGCTGGPYEVGRRWGVYNNVLCLGNEKVYRFCEDVLDEIMRIFPSKLIHIGGDESPTVRWEHCPKCRKVAKEHGLAPKTIQGYFTSRVEKFVISKGRRIIGWDEVLAGNVNQSATIMSWRNAEYGKEAAEKGHDVIMSPTSHCYFDYNQAEGERAKFEPTLCGGYIPVEQVYSFEPYAEGLSEEAKPHILGVQANLWAEYLSWPNQVEYQVLPRMAALADVQWASPKKDYVAFLCRLNRLVELYDLYGLNYARHLWPERMVSPWAAGD